MIESIFICTHKNNIPCHAQLCTDDYFLPTSFLKEGIIFIFPCSLARTTDEIEHPWCLYSHGGFLINWRSNFAIFRSTQRSPTHEHRRSISAIYLVTIDIDILGVVDNFIWLLIFYKPIQGSSGVMHLCMFLSMVSASLGGFAYIILCLLAQPFLGLVGEADYPPVGFLPKLAWLDSTHFFKKQCVSQQLGYFIALASQPCPIWTFPWGIRSVLEGIFIFTISLKFLSGFQSGQKILTIVSARYGLSVLSNIFRKYPLFLTGPLFQRHLFLGALAFLSVSYDDRGSKIIGGYCYTSSWVILSLIY